MANEFSSPTFAMLKSKVAPTAELITETTESWLESNVDPDTGYVLDRTLTMENAAAPADMVGGLQTAFTQLDDDVHDDFYLVDTTARVEWEQGRIQSENGQNANSDARIRTVGYFGNFNGVNSIGVANDAYFVVFAYSGDTYVGMWNPTTETFGSSSYWVTTFNCHANDNYKYRINVKKGSAGTDNITPTYGANIVFNENPEYVPAVEKSSPSKNIGFGWEDGNIDIDTGNDATGSGYRRSKYIPVEGGKTYAFNIAENENAYSEYVFFYDENKIPILIDTENNRYYIRAGIGWFPKMLEIPSNKGIAFVRWRWGNSNIDLYHGQAEENIISTSYRSPDLIEIENEHMPNNIRGYIGKRILLLGDSITAQNNWSKWFEASVKPEVLYNYAVGGATWLDPTSGIIYDGTSGTYNVLGNQVQRVLNNSLKHIDCIIILAGTNDTNYTVPTDEQIETAFFDNSMNVIDLADVDRTTWQGAMRWCLEKLILTYPSAKIFVCSPLQRVYKASDGQISLYSSVKAKGEIIEKMCKRMGVEFVDTEQCGISSCRSLYYADGLHPIQRASEKIARFIMAKYMAWFCQN